MVLARVVMNQAQADQVLQRLNFHGNETSPAPVAPSSDQSGYIKAANKQEVEGRGQSN